jgi:hypothetical protein
LVSYIISEKIKVRAAAFVLGAGGRALTRFPCCDVQSTAQLDGAFEYLKKIANEPLDVGALEESAGVGIEVRMNVATT